MHDLASAQREPVPGEVVPVGVARALRRSLLLLEQQKQPRPTPQIFCAQQSSYASSAASSSVKLCSGQLSGVLSPLNISICFGASIHQSLKSFTSQGKLRWMICGNFVPCLYRQSTGTTRGKLDVHSHYPSLTMVELTLCRGQG